MCHHNDERHPVTHQTLQMQRKDKYRQRHLTRGPHPSIALRTEMCTHLNNKLVCAQIHYEHLEIRVRSKEDGCWLKISQWVTTGMYSIYILQARYLTDLLDRKLQQLWQAGSQHANEKWCGGAADIQHAGWQHRNEGVLPGEGVKQRQHRVATPR